MVRLLILCITGLVLLGCVEAEVPARTQLILVADTDIARLETIEFSILGPDGRMKTAKGPSGAEAKGSRSLGLLYDGGKLGPFVLTATGLMGETPLLSRSATVWFEKGKTRVVPLHLVEDCIGVTCPGKGEQCTERRCQPSELKASDLSDWNGRVPSLSDAVKDGGMPPNDAALSMPDGGATPDDGGTSDGGTNDGGIDFDPNEDASVDLPDGGMAICDGVLTDLRSDDMHCGRCDKACIVPPSAVHAANECIDGRCVPSCEPNWRNCDGKVINGCEADLASKETCGACGVRCVGNRECIEGACIKRK